MLIASTSFLDVHFTRAYVALAIIAALLTWIFMGKDESQTTALQSNGLTVAGQIGIGWLGVVGALLLIGYATKSSDIFSRRALFLWFVATPAVLVGASLCLRQWLRMAMLSARNLRSAVIIGASKMSLELARIIHDRPELGLKLRRLYSVKGAADDSPLGADELAFLSGKMDVETCDDLAAVGDYVNARHIDVVFVALPTGSPNMRAILEDLRDTTSSVYLIPDVSLFDLIQAQSADIEGIPVVALCESPLHGVRYVMKRVTDIVLAALLLTVASPLMVGIAIAIKLTSPGRVLFKQDRYGLDGERITVYKFRSMTCCDNGDRIVQAKRNDARVTRVGAF